MTEWLYQIRIGVTSALSTDLRSLGTSTTAQKVIEIAKKNMICEQPALLMRSRHTAKRQSGTD